LVTLDWKSLVILKLFNLEVTQFMGLSKLEIILGFVLGSGQQDQAWWSEALKL
jgi:hypothetical protein